jgi:magnesium-protoporphyrin O-methyltransferase
MKFAAILVTLSFVGGASAFAPVFPNKVVSVTATSLYVVDDKTEVREYFNTEGFNRWNKIYTVTATEVEWCSDGHS